MKYKPSLFLAYFFYKAGGGGHGPLAPPPGSVNVTHRASVSKQLLILLLESTIHSFFHQMVHMAWY